MLKSVFSRFLGEACSILARVGVDPCTVCCMSNFYQQLRHRFRHGQVDGLEWFMANGVAHGCPAGLHLMTILFEPFLRWAVAQKKGFAVADTFVASASFADDVTLVEVSLEEVQFLISDYQA